MPSAFFFDTFSVSLLGLKALNPYIILQPHLWKNKDGTLLYKASPVTKSGLRGSKSGLYVLYQSININE